MLAPNALKMWKIFDRKKFKQGFWYLKKKKLIEIKEREDGEMVVVLTEKGRKKILKFKFEEMKIEKPKKWDGRWRIVSFDIPEKKKIARNVLREKLKSLGFFQLQKSVFIHPYECEDQIKIIKEVYEIWPYVNYIVAEELDNEEKLKEKFNL